MRAAHSLKGAARIVGLEAAVRVAHALEDHFVAAQRGEFAIRTGHVDVMLRAVDLLSRIAQLPEDAAPAWQAENEGLVAGAVAGLEGLRRAAAAPARAAAGGRPAAASPDGPAAAPVPPPGRPRRPSPVEPPGPSRAGGGGAGPGRGAGAGGPGRGGEPLAADGPGRGVAGPGPPAPAVR